MSKAAIWLSNSSAWLLRWDHRDSDFHSPEIAALLGAARALRGIGRTGNNGFDE